MLTERNWLNSPVHSKLPPSALLVLHKTVLTAIATTCQINTAKKLTNVDELFEIYQLNNAQQLSALPFHFQQLQFTDHVKRCITTTFVLVCEPRVLLTLVDEKLLLLKLAHHKKNTSKDNGLAALLTVKTHKLTKLELLRKSVEVTSKTSLNEENVECNTTHAATGVTGLIGAHALLLAETQKVASSVPK